MAQPIVPPGSRGRALRRLGLSLLRILVTVCAILWVYAVAPIPNAGEEKTRDVIGFVGALVVFGSVFGWQISRIRRSDRPLLRAVEGGVTILALFLVVFAWFYQAGDALDPGSFSEPLDDVTALYFTITVFATVGFGDITPVVNPMRIAVSVQMLLDLAFIGFAVKVLAQVAKDTSASRRQMGESQTAERAAP